MMYKIKINQENSKDFKGLNLEEENTLIYLNDIAQTYHDLVEKIESFESASGYALGIFRKIHNKDYVIPFSLENLGITNDPNNLLNFSVEFEKQEFYKYYAVGCCSDSECSCCDHWEYYDGYQDLIYDEGTWYKEFSDIEKKYILKNAEDNGQIDYSYEENNNE